MATLGALIVELRANSLQFRTELENARRGLTDTSRSAAGTGVAVRDATQTLRLFGGQILSQVNPALGGLVIGMAHAGREARTFGGAWAGLTVGAVAVTAAVAALLERLKQAQEAQVRMNVAVRGLDAGAIRTELGSLAKELEHVRQTIITPLFGGQGTWLEQLMAMIRIPFNRSFAEIFGDIEKRQAELVGTLSLEAQKAVAENNLKLLEADKAVNAVAMSYAEATGNAEEFERTNRRLVDILGDVAKQQAFLIDNQAVLDRQRAVARLAPSAELDLIEANRVRALQALKEATSAGLIGAGESFRRGDLQLSVERLQVEQRRLSLLRDEVGISEQERDLRALAAIEAERVLKITEAQGNVAKENLADLEAELARRALIRQELERGLLGAAFAGVSSQASSAVANLLDQTTTVEQAFRSMTISIRNSILENVIDKGIRAAHDALFKWLADLAAAGLLRGVLGAVLGAGFGAGAPTTGAGPGVAGPIGPPTQHGGVFTRPQIRLIGEAGPEAVIPLRGGAVPVVGGRVVVINNIHNEAPGTEVQQSQSTGANGEILNNFVIRAIKRAAQTGELDSIMGTYGIRRPGLSR